jgi:hypothetical protein
MDDPFAGFVVAPNGNLIDPWPAGTPWPDQEIGLGVHRCPEPIVEEEHPTGGPSRDQIIIWLRAQGIRASAIAERFGIGASRVYKIVAADRPPRDAS